MKISKINGRMLAAALRYVAFGLFASIVSAQTHAATIVAQVKDRNGNGVPNAVVYAIPVGTTVPSVKAGTTAQVEQVQMKYEPFVSIVQKGTQMRFPNKDRADHHVKVLSGPQLFEFGIFTRKEPPPVLLDKPGMLTLQCLLHNWMSAHIYVVDTPYFNKSSSSGTATILDVPAGEYEVHVTHPSVGFPGQVTPARPMKIKLDASGSQVIDVKLDLVPRSEPRRRASLDY